MMHTAVKVVHSYVDRAPEPDPPATSMSTSGRAANRNSGSSSQPEQNFPRKLHYMLSSVEADGQAHIVSWQPHGRCFMVHNLKEFVNSMLPLWFRQSKHASFQRQLNLYGFQRITQGRDKGAYYHEYFLRGRPLLAQNITRTKVKGKGARKASNPDTEPRFYEYPWMGTPAQNAAAGAGTATAGQSMMMPANYYHHPGLHGTVQASGGTSLSTSDPPGHSAEQFLSIPMTSWSSNPTANLGDALSFFVNDQAQSAPSQEHHPQSQPQANGEQMILPGPPYLQDSNFALISSLVSNSGSSSTSSNPNSGTTTPSTGMAASTQYIPIAPAPPNYKHGSDGGALEKTYHNVYTTTMKTSVDSSSTATTANGSVLAAMKVQNGALTPTRVAGRPQPMGDYTMSYHTVYPTELTPP